MSKVLGSRTSLYIYLVRKLWPKDAGNYNLSIMRSITFGFPTKQRVYCSCLTSTLGRLIDINLS